MSNYNDNLSEKYLELAKELEILFKKYNKYYDSSEYLVKLIKNYKNQNKELNQEVILDKLLIMIKDHNLDSLNKIYPLPKVKKFFSENSNLERLDDKIKNSDDAKYIYRMLLISQKMNFKDNDIDELKKTDFLEKLLYSYIKFGENRDISNLKKLNLLKNLIENSIRPILTIDAFINYYDSDGKKGSEYLEDFSHNPINENYLDPIEFRDQINASVNILTDSREASGVVYKINKEKDEVIIIKNAHVIDDANEVNVQFINDIKPKKAHYLSFKDKKEIDIGIIVLKMEKDEIDKLKEPKINIDYNHSKLIAFGNSMGFGSTDKSTNMTQGKKTFDNDDDDDNIITIDMNFFLGNSGCGIFNEKGELIGIYRSGKEITKEFIEKQDPELLDLFEYPELVAGITQVNGIKIETAKIAADELISEYYEKKAIRRKIITHLNLLMQNQLIL